MSQDPERDRWSEVDRYLGDLLLPHDTVLNASVAAAETAGLPPSRFRHSRDNGWRSSPPRSAPNRSSRSARSAATAPSGWPVRSRPADTSSRWSWIPHTPPSRAPISNAPGWVTARRSGSDPRRLTPHARRRKRRAVRLDLHRRGDRLSRLLDGVTRARTARHAHHRRQRRTRRRHRRS